MNREKRRHEAQQIQEIVAHARDTKSEAGGQYKCAYAICECEVSSLETYCSD
jgi:hypothetical protein